jgi:uncharacterized protein (TIGR03546 family)
MFIKWLARIVVAINSNVRPSQICLGVCFAVLLALIPASVPAVPSINLLWIAIFIVTFFIKINAGVECVFLALFKLLVPLVNPFISTIGYTVLSIPVLFDFFTVLSNIPIIYFFHLNHTLVMGSLVLGIALFAPVYLVSRALLKLYRDSLREKIANSRLVKGFFKIPLVAKLSGAFGRAADLYSSIR